MNAENREKQQEMQILTLNICGRGFKPPEEKKPPEERKPSNKKYGDRLGRLCAYMKSKMNENTLALGLQEVMSGKEYLLQIKNEFPDFHFILPAVFKNQPRSAISLLLLNKNMVKNYKICKIEGLEDSFSLLYNLIYVTMCSGEQITLLNVHVPPKPEKGAEMYKMERKELRALFYTQIQRIAKSEPNFILLGDMNKVPDSEVMRNLAYSEGSPMRDSLCENQRYSTTCKNSKVDECRLDYILFSRTLAANIAATVDNTTRTNTPKPMSDHALLIAEAKNYA